MKVNNNASVLRHRVLPSVLIGLLLCNAAPAALAQAALSSVNDTATANSRVTARYTGSRRRTAGLSVIVVLSRDVAGTVNVRTGSI